MNTAAKRIQALAAVLPNDVIEFLSAHLCLKNTENAVYSHYEKAFCNDADVKGQDIYTVDKHPCHFEEIEDKLWNRACTALENWIYETYYN